MFSLKIYLVMIAHINEVKEKYKNLNGELIEAFTKQK